jgi:hypothetical protein
MDTGMSKVKMKGAHVFVITTTQTLLSAVRTTYQRVKHKKTEQPPGTSHNGNMDTRHQPRLTNFSTKNLCTEM